MRRHGIPTAAFEVFDDYESAAAYIRKVRRPGHVHYEVFNSLFGRVYSLRFLRVCPLAVRHLVICLTVFSGLRMIGAV